MISPHITLNTNWNINKVWKNINIVLVTIFHKFQNLQKLFLLERSKVIMTCSILKIFYLHVISPHITLNPLWNINKVWKNINIVLVTIFHKFQNLQKLFLLERSKVIMTCSILKIFYLHVISPHITLNPHWNYNEVWKNVIIVHVSIFDKFQNSPNIVFNSMSKVIITVSIL